MSNIAGPDPTSAQETLKRVVEGCTPIVQATVNWGGKAVLTANCPGMDETTKNLLAAAAAKSAAKGYQRCGNKKVDRLYATPTSLGSRVVGWFSGWFGR